MLSFEEDRAQRLVLAGVMVSIFGPYIAGGVRTEHLAVYGTAAVAGLLVLVHHRAGLRPLVALAGVWSVYLLTAIMAAVVSTDAVGSFSPGRLGAGLDNLVLPMAALTVGAWLALSAERVVPLLRIAILWLVGLMMLNSVAVGLQVMGMNWRPWWAEADMEVTVAEAAEGNWRYSGLLNQPAESGFLYSLALVLAVLLLRRRPWTLLACVVVLALGAVSAVSKIFLLLGVPMALVVYLWGSRQRRRDMAVVVGAGALGLIALVTGVLDEWSGSYQLRQILPTGDQSLLSSLTASRFGETSTLGPVIEAVWEASPIIGVGAGGLAVSYDNGWLEAFIGAGTVGILCYSASLALILRRSWTLPPGFNRAALGATGAVATLVSAGLPSLTANRCASVLWMLVGLMWLGGDEERRTSQKGSLAVPSHEGGRYLGSCATRRRARPAVNGSATGDTAWATHRKSLGVV
jgi:hypothetical protein